MWARPVLQGQEAVEKAVEVTLRCQRRRAVGELSGHNAPLKEDHTQLHGPEEDKKAQIRQGPEADHPFLGNRQPPEGVVGLDAGKLTAVEGQQCSQRRKPHSSQQKGVALPLQIGKDPAARRWAAARPPPPGQPRWPPSPPAPLKNRARTGSARMPPSFFMSLPPPKGFPPTARASSLVRPVCRMARISARASWASSSRRSRAAPAGVVGDEALGSGVGGDPALFFQKPVGLLHGVGIDAQPGRQHPPGGQLVPVGDGARRDARLRYRMICQ